MTFKRYTIYLVDLNPAQGSEINKTRPAVIVSMDGMNEALGTIVVCPLTTTIHSRWRSRIQVLCAGKRAEIAVDQIRSISKARFKKQIDKLANKKAGELRRLISEMYGEG